MVSLPRLVVAAPSTGQGKTTIATGLMAALRARGHAVSGHKVGPDYIDPGYHALATGRPGRNLDPHLVGVERIVPLLLHGAAVPTPADVAIIEGVMGLYDGRIGTEGFASTAHVASLTRSPVVLVLDIARLSRTAGAIVAGLAAYDDNVTIAGVVLNRAGSARNIAEITRSIERTGIPVLGTLPRDETLAAPSRHLGLVPVAERDGSVRMIERLGEQVAEHLDLDALLDVGRSAPDLAEEPWQPSLHAASTQRPVIAMAGGRAFTFRYPETEELLAAAGCEVVTFDPLTDPHLPEGVRGLYLGGGFPEVYAGELAANVSLIRDIRAAVSAGLPTVAECAGLLYLADSLDGVPMAGVVPTRAAMSERLTLRYPTAVAAADSLLGRVGEQVSGHEFHRTRATPAAGSLIPGSHGAWQIDGEPTGFATNTWHASYLHVHWAGHPQLAQRFADAAHAATRVDLASASISSASFRADHGSPADLATSATDFLAADTSDLVAPTAGPSGHSAGAGLALASPLRHHGDAETGAGLLDFAVNVFTGARPEWLDLALHTALDSHDYPDVTPARHALARHHGRGPDEVLPTSGAAEAFTLIARLEPWRKPVVVHPQFTEPHAALEQAGHTVTSVFCGPEDGFALPGSGAAHAIPDDADLVVIGNPTNPTGVLHPAAAIGALMRPGRLVVVDEAFMDAVPGEAESLVAAGLAGVVVIRSLTKHWSIPGIRAGYVVGDPVIVGELAQGQTPWSVSAPAIAAMIACSTDQARSEAAHRAELIGQWREGLHDGLRARGIPFVESSASFVLARLGEGARDALRGHGVAVRRADTFPGLDSSWARIAVRPQAMTARLFTALDSLDSIPLSQPALTGPHHD